jgi:hypothetical protein
LTLPTILNNVLGGADLTQLFVDRLSPEWKKHPPASKQLDAIVQRERYLILFEFVAFLVTMALVVAGPAVRK